MLLAINEDINIQKILKFLGKTTKINAIIIVQNGSSARLDLSVENALVRLRNSLPLSARQNIGLILTNSAEAVTFKEECIPLDIQKSYMMDNSSFNVYNSTLDILEAIKSNLVFIKKRVAALMFKIFSISRYYKAISNQIELKLLFFYK